MDYIKRTLDKFCAYCKINIDKNGEENLGHLHSNSTYISDDPGIIDNGSSVLTPTPKSLA